MQADSTGGYDPFAELADLTIDIAREIRLRGEATLTATESQVMRFLHQHPHCTPSEVAAGTGLLRANVSPALAKLKRLGFVESVPDESDARSIRLRATLLAEQTLAQLRASWAAMLADAWPDEAPPEQTAAVFRSLLAGLIEMRNDG